MEKQIVRVNQGSKTIKVTVRYTADPSPGDLHGGLVAIAELFQMISNCPTMLCFDSACPNEIKVYYNGRSWVLDSVNQISET